MVVVSVLGTCECSSLWVYSLAAKSLVISWKTAIRSDDSHNLIGTQSESEVESDRVIANMVISIFILVRSTGCSICFRINGGRSAL